MATAWVFGKQLVLDRATGNQIQVNKRVVVYAADKVTQLTPLDPTGAPLTNITTDEDGLLPGFEVPVTANPDGTVWVLVEGRAATDKQPVMPTNLPTVLADLQRALAAVDTAVAEATAAKVAAQAATSMIQASDVGTIIGTDGRLLPQYVPLVAAQLVTGTDENGAFLDPSPGDTADRIYVMDKAGVQALIAAAGLVSVAPNSVVRRDAGGKTQVADPQAAQDAASKAYVDAKLNTTLQTSLPSGMMRVAYWDGAKYIYLGGDTVTTASRSGSWAVAFFGGTDPDTIGTGSSAITKVADMWFQEA